LYVFSGIEDYLMMSKLLKYISVYLLWLAGLTVSAHWIVPHDHHIADPYSYQDNNCPVSDSKSDHKSGFPIHCHAFNDLASERARPYHNSHNFRLSFIALSFLTDSDALILRLSCISISDFHKPIFDSYVFELSLLRAPPSLA